MGAFLLIAGMICGFIALWLAYIFGVYDGERRDPGPLPAVMLIMFFAGSVFLVVGRGML